MPIRNTHRVGDWLMVDEESGHIVYRSDCVKIWDGTYRRAKSYETRQPQEFVKAKSDPKALTQVRSVPNTASICNVLPSTIGNTSVSFPRGVAAHLYMGPGIGEAEIGCDFVVS